MAGYTRQSVADIVNGANITAPPLNAEFNQLQSAFGVNGHSHDGTAGNSPKIDLTTSISGYLPQVHGGTGGKNNTTATVNPTVNDDYADGYAPGSIWMNTTTGRLFICVTNTNGNATWVEGVAISPNNRITPLDDNTVDIGSSTYQFKDIYINGTGYIDAVSGDTLTLTSNASVGGNLTLTGNLIQSGNATITGTGYFGGNVTANANLTVNGNFVANGTVDLGNNTDDSISFTGRVDTSILPMTDGTYSLGSSSNQWQNLYIDGTAEIDQLNADSVDIDDGSIDNTVIGAGTRASGAFTGLTADGTVNFSAATVSDLGTVTTADINGGSVDGITLGTNSAVTEAQIDNINVNGNVITSTNTNGNIDITPNGTGEVNISKVDIDGGAIDGTVIGANSHTTGKFTTVQTTGQATLATVDINGGTIDNTAIGGSVPSSGSFTTVSASGGFTGDITGNVTGNVAGNLTGNVTGDVTGDLTGNVTASSGTSTFNNVTVNGELNMDAATSATIVNLTDPTNAQDAATKNYVDTNDALQVTRAGDTMSGNLTMTGSATVIVPTPTADTHAANKKYVDDEISAVIDAAPGALDTLNELAAAINDDANFSTTITNSIATKLPLAGGTMTGAIAMGTSKITGLGDPTSAQDAATKTYVDTNDALKLNLTGGTLTGNLDMGSNKVTSTTNPTADSDLSRKAYVDAQRDTRLATAGGTMSGAIAMGTNKITGLGDPTAAQDAVTKNYIDTLYGSVSSAATSASNAATSASAAATSASNAATSETNAANSATAAANSYDDFDDRYLGAKATAPTVDNDGDALITGALYFNTASDTMQVYGSSGWVPAGSSVNGTTARFKYTATASQTTFSGADDNSDTLAYDSGYLDVYLNGIRLVNGTDFTATSGTSIQLTSAAAVNDILEVVAYGTFTLATHYTKTEADARFLNVAGEGSNTTINANLDVNGTVTTDGAVVTGSNILNFQYDSDKQFYFEMPSGGASFDISKKYGGSKTKIAEFSRTDGTFKTYAPAVFNEDSLDADFRVESNDNTHMLFVDGGNNYVGIGEIPDAKLSINLSQNSSHSSGNGAITTSSSYNNRGLCLGNSGYGHLFGLLEGNSAVSGENYGTVLSMNATYDGSTWRHENGYIDPTALVIQNGEFEFYSDNVSWGNANTDYTPTKRMSIGQSGVVINETGADVDFRVESDNNANALFVDGGNDTVHINGSGASGDSLIVYADMDHSSTPFYYDSSAALHVRNTHVSGDTVMKMNNVAAGQAAIVHNTNGAYGFNLYDRTGTRSELKTTSTEVVINDDSADIDFRVESNNNTNAIFVDAGADRVELLKPTQGDGYVGFDFRDNGQSTFVCNNAARALLLNNISGTTHNAIRFQYATGTVGSINSSSSGTTYNTTSDRRLKDNIETITDGTDKLMAMNPVTHTWKADPEAGAVVGFIAQEMQEIVPEAVSGDPEGEEMMSMDYGRITPVIVAALQDAHKEIKALKERIEELEAK